MANVVQLESALVKADAAGDIEGARLLASEIRKMRSQPSAEKPKEEGYTFTPPSLDNLGTNLKTLAKGALSGTADIGNTLINAASYVPRKLSPELEKWNQQRESGLQRFNDDNADSTAFTLGRIGTNILGTAGAGGVLAKGLQGLSQAPRALQLAEALKSGGMAANGAGMGTRIAGGAISGATQAGLVNPEDAGVGAVVGGALPPGVKLAHALGKSSVGGVKSLVEPFYEGGRQNILGRTLTNAAGNQADDALRNLQTAKPLVSGSQPTAGMAAQNPGIAALERASVANSPIATNELALRQAANSDARLSAIEGIMPDKNLAEAARTSATQGLYNQSSKAPVKMTTELVELLQRPSMQKAVSRASELAKEAGEAFDLNNMTGKTAQYLKMSLDDMANSAPMTGIGGNELRSIQGTRQAFLDQLGEQIPEYLEANKQYASLSKPLNQADIIQEILSKGQNFRGELTPAAFSRGLSDKTAQRVTGRSNAKLAEALDPKQLDTLNNVKQDLLNQDFANTAGRGVGSNTVQNLAYTNMMDGFGIPTALRGFGPAGAIGNIASQVGNIGYKKANERLAAELAEALLDPRKAAEVMAKAKTSPHNAQLANALKLTAAKSAPIFATHQYSQ